jgi:hypothetical protein
MQAENILEGRVPSSRWRIFWVLFIATFQVLVVWRLVEESSAARWTFAWIAAPLTGVLITAIYDLATRGKPTQKVLWWAFLFAVSALGVDIFRLLHHSLMSDPFSAIVLDALWIGICIVWIVRHPFETKVRESIKSSVSVLRD